MSYRRMRSAAAFLIAALLACGQDRSVDGTAAQPLGTPLRIADTARLSVGVAEGDSLQEFHQVVTPFLLPNGHLVVPLAGSETIRVFNADGQFVRGVGRSGDGPGELSALIAAWPRGDTIEAFDLTNRRIVRYMPDGSSETVSVQVAVGDLSVKPGPLGAGWAVGGIAHVAPGQRDLMVIHRIDRTGADLGELTRVRGIARMPGEGFGNPEPLSPLAMIMIQGHSVYVAEGMIPKVTVFDSVGGLDRIITWSEGTRADPAQSMKVVVDSAIARARPDRANAVRARLETASVPDSVPILAGLIVDEEGFVWIRPYEPLRHSLALGWRAGLSGSWSVLTPEGVEVAAVEMPPDLEPMYIGSSVVLGRVRDDLGVESIRVHDLERRR